MSAVGNESLTMVDLASRMENGEPAKEIIELQNKMGDLAQFMPFEECNQGNVHVTTQRVGLPEGTWRKLNQGVQPTKSQTAQVKDECAMLEAESVVDQKLLKLSRNPQRTLLIESMAHLEGMKNQVNEQFIYGTRANPERFPGLVDRFNNLSSADSGTDPQPTSDNVINGGGTGSTNTSLWIVGFGPGKVHGLYPANSKAGISITRKPDERVLDGNGGSYIADCTRYQQDLGFSVPDWRFVVRICNIDVALLTKDAGSGPDVIDLLIQGVERIHNLSGRTVILGNRVIGTWLRRQMLNRPGTLLSLEDFAGKRFVSFDGIPYVRMDEIVNTEEAVA